jgi:hypothetical protein
MDAEAFPFLDLPKDIRLMVYDLLITRSHKKISWTKGGDTASITLVTENPIPPIHVTCKSLHAECVPFFKAKIERMVVPRTTPRMIVHAGHPNLLSRIDGVLDDVYYCIKASWARDTVNLATDAYFYENLDTATEQDTDVIAAVLSYTDNVVQFFKANGHYFTTWYQESEELLMRRNDKAHLNAPDTKARQLIVRKYAKSLMSEPSSRSKAIHILLLGSEASKCDSSTLTILHELAKVCDMRRIRAYVHGLGLKDGGVTYEDPHGFLCYEGVMNEKTWTEEWA